MKTFATPKGTILPLLELQGKPYLQPAHRLIWFLEENSGWAITASYLPCPDGYVLAEVSIKDGSGFERARAHSLYKFEENAYESAETGAMGRALAWLGYGTQFAGNEIPKVVDSPVPAVQKNYAPSKTPTIDSMAKKYPPPSPR